MEETIMKSNLEQQKIISIELVKSAIKSGQANNVIYFLILLLILLNIQAISIFAENSEENKSTSLTENSTIKDNSDLTDKSTKNEDSNLIQSPKTDDSTTLSENSKITKKQREDEFATYEESKILAQKIKKAEKSIFWIDKKYNKYYDFFETIALVTDDKKTNYVKVDFMDKISKDIVNSIMVEREVLTEEHTFDFVFDSDLIKIKRDGKYGYIDNKGKEVVKCKYDDALGFSDGLSAVKLNGYWGYVDRKGNEITKLGVSVSVPTFSGAIFVSNSKAASASIYPLPSFPL